ncbi:ABC transporter permease [Salinibacterium sp. SWN167]|uniref:ABC transporter permease n=1 Tax=Salinibacterium sp. SWN167 TaxID=2792054 RepID=UPI0018CE4772|nr:ABC transporter permease [Salinibacterium sp. SWN167]MBH0084075.1 ABC transporter permease [Salinibacterium sp. SWN167]
MTDKKPVVDEQSVGQELSIEQRATVGLSQGAIVRRRFLQHRGAVVSVFVLLFLVLLAFTSVGTVIGGTGKLTPDPTGSRLIVDGFRIPGWWGFTWWERYDIVLPGGAPTFTWWPFSFGEHPFGQDNTGKDVFARVMRGMQQSLNVVFIVGIISTVIGVVLGALAGYYRGWVDQLIMRITDVIIIVPLLILGAVLGQTIGGDAFLLAVMIGLIAWTGMARLVRAEFLSLREREFVDAARVAGASDFRIIFRHILPNTVGVIVVSATLLMSAVILLETSLSFLGFGITAPDISLGQIISEYNEAFKTRPWLFWWPGLFIVIIALCINFIGDGLRDAFDPRQKRVPRQRGLGSEIGNFFKAYIPGTRPGDGTVNK